MRNIAFVGFMGTGKTAASKEVARRLNLEYVNMDSLIESRQEKSINRIFSENGEPYFRDLERVLVEELSKKSGLVIDCGGGVVLNQENIDNLKTSGIIICLTASADIIYERVKLQSHRPLLNVLDPKVEILGLLKLREPFYEKADFNIDTSGLSIKQVVERVLEIVKGSVK